MILLKKYIESLNIFNIKYYIKNEIKTLEIIYIQLQEIGINGL